MLVKSELGRAELRPGSRTLGQRERAILLMADGKKVDAELFAMYGGEGRTIVAELIRRGYLEEDSTSTAAARKRHAHPSAETQPSAVLASATSSNVLQAVDNFSGARSLASARMFLFDLTDRLFAPRDKSLAEHYRHALREARDASSMLTVSRAMLREIEKTAGGERADSIAERLAKLLPEYAMN